MNGEGFAFFRWHELQFHYGPAFCKGYAWGSQNFCVQMWRELQQ